MDKIYFLLAAVLVLVQACTTYHRMPLNSSTVAQKLLPPQMQTIRVRAKSIKHPLLKPVTFDERNGLSPDEAAILAVLANPALRAIRDEKGISTAQTIQAGILPNPQVSYSLDVPTGGNTEGTINAFGLGLNWDITSLLAQGTRVRAARNHSISVDLDVAWQEWQVAQAARLHVFRLVILKKQLALATKVEKQLKETLAIVQRAFSLRAETVVDLNAAKVAYQQAYNRVLTLQQKYEHERHALNKTLGLPADSKVRLQRDIKLPSWQTLPREEKLITGLEKRRLDLLALKKGYNSQEAQVRAAILSQFPKINIGVTHARDTGDVITTGFAITVDLPFFDRNQGQIAIKRATRKRLFDEYVARVFEARSTVASILGDMKFIKQDIKAAQDSVYTLGHLVQAYKKALEEGNADILSYNNIRVELNAKRLGIFQLKRDLADMGIALEIAAGKYLEQTRENRKLVSHD